MIYCTTAKYNVYRRTNTWDTEYPREQLSSVQFGTFSAFFIDGAHDKYYLSRSIHHDEDVYPEPEEFKPERFLDKDGVPRNTEESRVLGHHLYGFGRRYVLFNPDHFLS